MMTEQGRDEIEGAKPHDGAGVGPRRVQSGAPWEEEVGYCRALRSGDAIFVGGTAPVRPDGSCHAPGDPKAQARRCLEIALGALAALGGSPADVVRTRMFVTDIEHWRAFGEAHAEVFAEHRPVATMVEVQRLIDPEMLIEIELDAIVRPRAREA